MANIIKNTRKPQATFTGTREPLPAVFLEPPPAPKQELEEGQFIEADEILGSGHEFVSYTERDDNFNKPSIMTESQKKFSNALESFDNTLSINPNADDAIFNKSLIKLRLGELSEGWDLYSYGLTKNNNIREINESFFSEETPLWDGQPFNGTLLVYAEQGIGDQLMFGAIIEDLLKVQNNVAIIVDDRLKKLFEELKIKNEESSYLIEQKIWEIWSTHPNNNELTNMLDIGSNFVNNNQLPKAVEIFTQIIIKFPFNPHAYFI